MHNSPLSSLLSLRHRQRLLLLLLLLLPGHTDACATLVTYVRMPVFCFDDGTYDALEEQDPGVLSKGRAQRKHSTREMSYSVAWYFC